MFRSGIPKYEYLDAIQQSIRKGIIAIILSSNDRRQYEEETDYTK